jgi:hypothetical protein
MLQEVIEKRARFLRSRSRAGRTTYNRIRECGTNTRNRIVVELVILLRSSVPICNVRFVPNLEIPGTDLLLAVPLHNMLCVLPHQLSPHGVVLRWIVGSSRDGTSGIVNLVIVHPRNSCSKILGHKTQFDHGADACPLKLIKGLVSNREVIHGFAVCVLGEYIR